MLTFLTLIEDDEEKKIFETLYHTYEQQLFHIAYAILKDAQLAEDAVHNTFMKVLRHLRKIEKMNEPRTKSFLTIIVKNASIDIYRKRSSLKEFYHEEVFDVPAPDKTDESTDIALQIIRTLPVSYQNIFLLKYVHELTDKEISTLLDIKGGTLRQRFSRGKQLLRDKL